MLRRLPGSLPWASSGYGTLLVFALAMMTVARITLVSHDLQADTWLGLVDGRAIIHAGLSHQDTTAIMFGGRPFVDQPWLAQLVLYGLVQLGGLSLMAVFCVLLLSATLAGATVAARRLGAASRSILLVLPLAWWLTFSLVGGVRPEALVLPLFVVLLDLLAVDARRMTKRVYLVIPVLVLWANLHGSAVLAAALIALRGATLAWERRKCLRERRQWVCPVVLLLAPVCLFATPYGIDTLTYYRSTIFNSALAHNISEWQPLASAPLLFVPAVVGAAMSVWVLRRTWSQLPIWRPLALGLLAASALLAQRNAIWFGLAVLVLVAPAIKTTRALSSTRSRSLVNAALAGGASLLALGATALVLSRPDPAFQTGFSNGALEAVRTATTTDSSMRVFADAYIADWLLWRAPELVGRIAYDDHLELLTPKQFDQLDRLRWVTGRDWSRVVQGYRLVVLTRGTESKAIQALSGEAGAAVLYQDSRDVVILRSRSAAE